MTERLLTARELADRLNVSASWVYQYRGPGRVKVGAAVRFDYATVFAHLQDEAVAS
jgi:predicted DNA-binding transcriptional regulator AlpA